MITNSINILRQLQYPSGLFAAASKDVKTGYDKAWLRDNVYAALGLEAVKDKKSIIKAYRALLDAFKKHENKIDWAIKEKPQHRYQYIHARIHPTTFEEFHEDWANKQNDAVGVVLFKIGDLQSKGIKVLRKDDMQIIKKLILYLNSIEFWHDKDNGIWEENEEVHASSVGACVAGLQKIKKVIDFDNIVTVSLIEGMIQKGRASLNKLLPRESETKEVDLALLSLIYPYNIVSESQKLQILKNVETKLVRKMGVLRYLNDQYYKKDGEAEWTMGFPWLAIIYKQLNQPERYAYYMRKTVECFNEKGELPELYYSNTQEHNENSPLGWAQALYLVMMKS